MTVQIAERVEIVRSPLHRTYVGKQGRVVRVLADGRVLVRLFGLRAGPGSFLPVKLFDPRDLRPLPELPL